MTASEEHPEAVPASPAPGAEAGDPLRGSAGRSGEKGGSGRDGGGQRRVPVIDLTTAQRAFVKYVTLVSFALMFGLFSLLEPSVFPTWDNIRSILDLAAPIVILAVGLTVVLLAGEFDLSFQALVGVGAVVAVKTMSDGGAPASVAILAALGACLAGGLVAGTLVSFQRATSFIVTLALGSVWAGLALGISGGGLTNANVTRGYTDLTQKDVASIPLSVIYAAVATLLVFALIRWTIFGREVEAIGGNPAAARLAGIRMSLTRIGAFGVLGVCAGIAAVILSSRTGQYSAGIASGLFIPPFVAAFFGMSVLANGRFNVFGTLIGALFIATLQTGLVVIGSEEWVANVIVGAVLLATLFLAARGRETP